VTKVPHESSQGRLGSTRILGKRPTAHAEHVVVWFELRNVPANRFDLARRIDAESYVCWFSQAGISGQRTTVRIVTGSSNRRSAAYDRA
jgi:hypothetical protein